MKKNTIFEGIQSIILNHKVPVNIEEQIRNEGIILDKSYLGFEDNICGEIKKEGDKFVIKDSDPTCFSFLKSIFCNCFGKKNQQENIQRGRDQTPSSDHSLHPSSSFVVDGGLSLTSNRSDIFLN